MPDTARWSPYAAALLRIVAALLLLEHATMKFLQFPAAIPGVPYPLPTLIVVAGIIEVITGSLMLIGFYTRIAAFIASGLMAAAYWIGHAPRGFWPALNMGEPAILFCFIFLYFAFAGPGAFALDDLARAPARRNEGA